MYPQHFSVIGHTITRNVTLIFLMLVGLMLASGWAKAQDNSDATAVTDTIFGMVTDEVGSPINRIQVTVPETRSLSQIPASALNADRQGLNAPCDLLARAPMQISLDGKYLLYRISGSPGWDLYSFSTTDGTAVNLGSAGDGDGYRFHVSPDSQYVVFFSWDDGLRSLPIGDGAPFRLSSVGSDVKISPDSNWVVYKDLGYLYRVPITGGTRPTITHCKRS